MRRESALVFARSLRPIGMFAAYFVGGLWLCSLAMVILGSIQASGACLLGCLLFMIISNGCIKVRDQYIHQHNLTYKELYDEEIPTGNDDMGGVA